MGDKIIGKTFGKLTVIEEFKTEKKYTYKYLCKCSCEDHTTVITTKYRLLNGKISDCGCVRKNKNMKDRMSYIGKTYNKLTIINFIGKRKNIVSDAYFYECQCTCGRVIYATLYDLTSNRLKSCGKCRIISEEQKKKISELNKKTNAFIFHPYYVECFTEEGESFICDLEDYERIIEVNKYISIPHGYPLFSDRKNGDFQVHRFIMGLGKFDKTTNLIVDHINGITTDCRKENLRICYKTENPKNSKTYKNNTSGHKGVSWVNKLQKWQVNIQYNGKSLYLGIYEDIQEAIEVRKEAEIKYFGEYSRDYREELLNE